MRPCIRWRFSTFGAALGLVLVLGALPSCNEIAGIEPARACAKDADCAAEAGCGACQQQVCVFLADGQELPAELQVKGDCHVRTCDGRGGPGPVRVDDEDLPAKANDCVFVSCTDGEPLSGPIDGSAPCYGGPPEREGVGICTRGTRACENGALAGECLGYGLPELERCVTSEQDLDCDGVVHEPKDGTTVCCGDGVVEAGVEECDDGNDDENDACSPDCRSRGVVAIATGANHSCALLLGGAVKCWGLNGYGQLGLGDTLSRGVDPTGMGTALGPVDLGSKAAASQIAAGATHTCALLEGGIKCWGENDFGQLGLGDTAPRGDGTGAMGDALPFVDLGPGAKPIRLVAGGNHTCVILDDHSLRCWGRNEVGELGIGSTVAKGKKPSDMGANLQPVNLGPGVEVVDVASGVFHACAVLQDGSVKCWGANDFGQLGIDVDPGSLHQPWGDAPGEMANLPAVPLQKKATAVSVGRYHTCALLEDGLVSCWGRNDDGELGIGNTASTALAGVLQSPAGVSGGGSKVLAVAAGGRLLSNAQMVSYGHVCALLLPGIVKCWGSNAAGQLGLGGKLSDLDLGTSNNFGDAAGETIAAAEALSLGNGLAATAIAAGGRHNCLLLNDASVRCWGENDAGQLGRGKAGSYGDGAGETISVLGPVNLYGAPK